MFTVQLYLSLLVVKWGLVETLSAEVAIDRFPRREARTRRSDSASTPSGNVSTFGNSTFLPDHLNHIDGLPSSNSRTPQGHELKSLIPEKGRGPKGHGIGLLAPEYAGPLSGRHSTPLDHTWPNSEMCFRRAKCEPLINDTCFGVYLPYTHTTIELVNDSSSQLEIQVSRFPCSFCCR